MPQAPEEFVDRTEEIELVESLLAGVREGNRLNLCFAGVPGSGRSAILARYLFGRKETWVEEGVILVDLPLAGIGESAIDLGIRIVSSVAAAFLEAVGARAEARRIREEDTFRDEARRMRSPALEGFTETLERFEHQEGLEPEGLLVEAFRFPEAFASEKGLRLILFADDLDDLVHVRARPGRSAADLFQQAVEDQREVFYVVTIAPSPFADRTFLADDAPFQQIFQYFPVQALVPEAAVELASRLLGGGGEAAERAAMLSGGFPLYLEAIAKAARRAAPGADPAAADVDRAFASQVLSRFGTIHRHFEDILAEIPDADDRAAARALLAALAEGRKLGRADLAKLTGREGKSLGALLGRVLSLGMFRKVDNSFYFEDPLFRFWALKTCGTDRVPEGLTGPASARLASEFVTTYLEAPQEAQTEAPAPSGETPPPNVRTLLAACKGREVPGGLLGALDPVRFPAFERVQGFAFSSRDVKVYYLTGGDVGWLLLVFWKTIPVDRDLVEIFARRSQGRAHGLWFVGRGGFTPSAAAFARERGIYTSSEGDLRNLLEVVRS